MNGFAVTRTVAGAWSIVTDAKISTVFCDDAGIRCDHVYASGEIVSILGNEDGSFAVEFDTTDAQEARDGAFDAECDADRDIFVPNDDLADHAPAYRDAYIAYRDVRFA